MDVTNLIFLVEKHRFKRAKGGRKVIKLRRAFRAFTPEGLDEFKTLAGKYAAERNEDFLIVQVVEEVSRPGSGPGTGDGRPQTDGGPVLGRNATEARPEPVRGCAHQKVRVVASGSGVMVMRCLDTCQAFVVQYAKGGQVAEWTLPELAEVLDTYLLAERLERLAEVDA